MKIREAGTRDVGIVRDLALAIWPDAYGKMISPEQLTYMLDLIYDEASLLSQMNNGQQFVILSDENDRPVGFASFSLKPEVTPISYRLNKLYVLSSEHKKGLGKLLLNFVIDTVNKEGAAKLDLTVNRQNPAQYFYHKMGFQIMREEDTDIGNGFFMNDYVMERNV